MNKDVGRRTLIVELENIALSQELPIRFIEFPHRCLVSPQKPVSLKNVQSSSQWFYAENWALLALNNADFVTL